MKYNFYTYIISNRSNTVLYTGVTRDLKRRMYEHKNKLLKGFSSRYNLDKLLYYEHFTDIHDAIACEKRLKSGSRAKKVKQIIQQNPGWIDLPLE